MHFTAIHRLLILNIFSLLITSPAFNDQNLGGSKDLIVGRELWEEILPLQMGTCFYQLQGLKPSTWYEVKISYPASIPASFSIQLTRGNVDLGLSRKRKLLNTEKLIFKTDDLESLSDQDGIHILVTVEPEGIAAIPHTKERQFIIFNIVCDELLLGIPRKAWWIVAAAVLCLGLALAIPSFLPSFLLARNRTGSSVTEEVDKRSTI